jgi:hypothetical protein
LILDPPEELEAVLIVGEQSAFKDREGQALKMSDPFRALGGGDWSFAVHRFTSFRQRVR